MARSIKDTIAGLIAKGRSAQEAHKKALNQRIEIEKKLHDIFLDHIEAKRNLVIGDRCYCFINGVQREVAIAGHLETRVNGDVFDFFTKGEVKQQQVLDNILRREPKYSCYIVTSKGLTLNTEHYISQDELTKITPKTKK